ncbi:MAG: hypothetical protein ACRC8A_18840 [Microcoleaceae cyanobacterium]
MTQHSSNPSEQDILDQPPSLTQSLDLTASLVNALTALLVAVCAKTGWEYGESWIPNRTHNVLELSPAWWVNTELDIHQTISWIQFQVCSKAFVLLPEEGIPGRVWQSQQPEWVEDASAQSETYFLRNQIAKALSVKAGFGIPILADAQVLAVVVFFMSKTRSPDPNMIAQTQAIVRNFQVECQYKV